MNDAKLKAMREQLDKAYDALDILHQMLTYSDEEKERQSVLLFGNANEYLTNPERFEKAVAAGLVDEEKPPFNNQTWLMYGYLGKDPRLTYAQIEQAKQRDISGTYDPYGGHDPAIFKGG